MSKIRLNSGEASRSDLKGKDFVYVFPKTNQEYTFNLSCSLETNFKYIKEMSALAEWAEPHKDSQKELEEQANEIIKLTKKKKLSKKDLERIEIANKAIEARNDLTEEMMKRTSVALARSVIHGWDIDAPCTEENIVQVLYDYPEVSTWVQGIIKEKDNFIDLDSIVKN